MAGSSCYGFSTPFGRTLTKLFSVTLTGSSGMATIQGDGVTITICDGTIDGAFSRVSSSYVTASCGSMVVSGSVILDGLSILTCGISQSPTKLLTVCSTDSTNCCVIATCCL